ncbi:hypothetical protein SCLCIDRAFT_1210631 [Scleroderma citrinum Foug A]|uniref:Uncharacterized protein n=1 Tax=Scleroderma citrinum Foug A TaxID=1036808 RepID=A0A0C3EGV4_9AGAM|nr:hypothetical protein SCLCIDRAFT_1210631 [Scleroderma citrinum Foug A]
MDDNRRSDYVTVGWRRRRNISKSWSVIMQKARRNTHTKTATTADTFQTRTCYERALGNIIKK